MNISELEKTVDRAQKKLEEAQEQLRIARAEMSELKKKTELNLTEPGIYLIKDKGQRTWSDGTRLLIKSNQGDLTPKGDPVHLISVNKNGAIGHSGKEYWLKEYDVVKKLGTDDLKGFFDETA